jgi:hypothetical protein|tara:strand:+ start:803 stop:1387 length:585 start_codon:yes stop_codon:yes gene_type:complete
MANGTLKVQNIQTSSGTGTITLGQSGETISVPSGATFSATAGTMTGQNYPAFMAYLNGNQTVSDATFTKVNLNAERLDTDNAFDSTTNYRFTVPSNGAGKYAISLYVEGYSSGASQLKSVNAEIRKNGTKYHRIRIDMSNNDGFLIPVSGSVIIDLAVSDYIELWGYVDGTTGTTLFVGDSDTQCFMNGYRIGA